MHSCGPLHMDEQRQDEQRQDEQRQDEQLVPIQDAALKTYRRDGRGSMVAEEGQGYPR